MGCQHPRPHVTHPLGIWKAECKDCGEIPTKALHEHKANVSWTYKNGSILEICGCNAGRMQLKKPDGTMYTGKWRVGDKEV